MYLVSKKAQQTSFRKFEVKHQLFYLHLCPAKGGKVNLFATYLVGGVD